MFKRLAFFVIAVLAFAGMEVAAHSQVAEANSGACGISGDVAGNWYYQYDQATGQGGSFWDSASGGWANLYAQEWSYRYTPYYGDGSGLTPGDCYVKVYVDGYEQAASGASSNGDIQVSLNVLGDAYGQCYQSVYNQSFSVVFSTSESGSAPWVDVSGCGAAMHAATTVTDYANWYSPDPAPDAIVSRP